MDENPLTPLPQVEYLPQDPIDYSPGIGLIGCGDITKNHLRAYSRAGYRVLAFCDIDIERATERRDEFYPAADVCDDYLELLDRDDVEVVDIATHPPIRARIIEAALLAGKHVLSQKPFVIDLDVGKQLVDLARRQGRTLAVNQNGRWAPHFSYARAAIEAGLIGEVSGVHLSVHWDHSWVKGTEFEKIKHLILYDYAIHWFDIVNCFLRGRKARRIYASYAKTNSQTISPPLLGQALIEYDDAQVTLAFDANTPVGQQDRSFISGSRGSISSVGSGNKVQTLTITTEQATWTPRLEGCWFPDGFHGTMGELLVSIEQGRRCWIDAEDNLESLALCFAAVASAESHQPVVPGSVTILKE